MKKKTFSLLCVLLLVCSLASCGQRSVPAQPVADSVTAGAVSTDLLRSDEHQDITWDLIQMTEHDPELKALLEKSIAQAYAMNPDPDTNPVSDLESYYAFLDRCYLGLPWEIHPSGKYSSLYDQIDQGMGCLYFVCNQPLPELEEKGYYHNSLMYLESGDRKVRRVLFRHLRLAVDRDPWRRHYLNGYRRIRGGDPCGNVPGIFREF